MSEGSHAPEAAPVWNNHRLGNAPQPADVDLVKSGAPDKNTTELGVAQNGTTSTDTTTGSQQYHEHDDETAALLPRNSNTDSVKSHVSYASVSCESSDSDSDLDPTIRALPTAIRDTVPLEDDPSVPVITFRYFLLLTILIIPGAFIDTMNSYRTTSAAYSIFFVQIVAHWAGKWLATTLPRKRIPIGRWGFQLNPGPWSIKETAMITITANSGATGNLATNAISLAELHFGERVPPVVAIGFMFAIVFIGYSYAAIAKGLLLHDVQFPWPQALMQTTLLQLQAHADTAGSSHTGARQMKVFFLVLSGVTAWQFLPEFIFPLTSSLAVLCWMAPHNETINFIGSGMGGMGVLNFSLDWANITSSIMLYPYWIQVIQFIAFVIGAWIMIPLAKWGTIVSDSGLMSNGLFRSNGQPYPVKELLTADLQFNVSAYEFYGPVNLGAQRAWNMFFDYAAYVSGIVWVVLFGYDQIRASLNRSTNTSKSVGPPVDRLNLLRKNYLQVPASWYIILFLVSFVTLMAIFLNGYLFMPWWCCIAALAMGSIIIIPLAWLYALSNFQLAIGTFNELTYGYLIQNVQYRHPAGALVFGSIAGDAWYRAQYHLHSMRLGFYNHLPPKAVFLSQLYGELIGVPMNYLALRWVLRTKRDYLTGAKIDPLHQWTGQAITTSHTNAIQYVVLGPDKLFAKYPWFPLGFLLGLVAPVVFFTLHKRYPSRSFHLWNTTVFFSSMTKFYGNLSTGYLSRFIGGTITMFWAFRYKHNAWKKYNYILAAAFDTGYNLAILLIFLCFSVFTTYNMPNWWGNDARSVERCFAL